MELLRSGLPLIGNWAVITEAPTPFGKTCAEQLAASGANLILVAADRDQLRKLATYLRGRYEVLIDIFECPPNRPDFVDLLFQHTQNLNQDVVVLINQTVVALSTHFIDLPWEIQNQFFKGQFKHAAHIAYVFAKKMRQQGFGSILQIAIPPLDGLDFQENALFHGFQKFLQEFSFALNLELMDSNVSCAACCPTAAELTTYQSRLGFEEALVPTDLQNSSQSDEQQLIETFALMTLRQIFRGSSERTDLANPRMLGSMWQRFLWFVSRRHREQVVQATRANDWRSETLRPVAPKKEHSHHKPMKSDSSVRLNELLK
ncbi:Hypothetical protein PBC10988_7590 [Planctomycetales bacterium 10988]|nr:Hypothetical protein PBC10988_7590 [Planctomycetales bacterium 10988]